MTNAAGFHVLRPPTLLHLDPTPLFVSVLLCQFPFSPYNMEKKENNSSPPASRAPTLCFIVVCSIKELN